MKNNKIYHHFSRYDEHHQHIIFSMFQNPNLNLNVRVQLGESGIPLSYFEKTETAVSNLLNELNQTLRLS